MRQDAEHGTVKAERNSVSQEPNAAQDESYSQQARGLLQS